MFHNLLKRTFSHRIPFIHSTVHDANCFLSNNVRSSGSLLHSSQTVNTNPVIPRLLWHLARICCPSAVNAFARLKRKHRGVVCLPHLLNTTTSQNKQFLRSSLALCSVQLQGVALRKEGCIDAIHGEVKEWVAGVCSVYVCLLLYIFPQTIFGCRLDGQKQ